MSASSNERFSSLARVAESARADAQRRRAGITACSWALAQDWTETELRDVLEAIGVLPYEAGGGTDALGGHTLPAARSMRRSRARARQEADTGEDVA